MLADYLKYHTINKQKQVFSQQISETKKKNNDFFSAFLLKLNTLQFIISLLNSLHFQIVIDN